MVDRGETQPFLPYSTTRRPQKSKGSFFLALGVCFVLLTGSWHALSYFSVALCPYHHANKSVPLIRPGRIVVVINGWHDMILALYTPQMGCR